MNEGSRCAAIVIALNERFIPPARVTIESIRRNGGPLTGVSLVVIVAELSSAGEDALEASAAAASLPLTIARIPDTRELGAIPAWALSTCLRLYAGDVCAGFDRALYLDSDMIVLSPLAPLLDVDLQGRTAAAVVNYPPLDVIRVAIPRARRGAVDGDAQYFNAGVLVIDTGRWMRRSIGEQSRAFLRQYPTTRLFDQDALNIALVDDWRPLEKEWNTPAGTLATAPMFGGLSQLNGTMTETIREWERAQQRPRILHFTGHPKPWESEYPWPDLREHFRSLVRPEFGSEWPVAEDKTTEINGQPRVRDFKRA